jgi:Concanavalin A-like lectin/glucanases superfamily
VATQAKIAAAGSAVLAAAALGCSLLVDTGGLAGHATAADASSDGRDTGTPAPVSDAASDTAFDAPSEAAPSVADAYAAAVLSDGPSLYLRLDEQAGSVAVDATGMQNAAYFGAVVLGTPGAFAGSSAISLDGNPGGVDAGPRFDFDGRKPMTLEAWHRTTNTDDVYRFLFCKELTDANGLEEYGIFLQVPDGFYFQRYVQGAARATAAPQLARDGLFHHIVITYDGSKVAFWVDGAVAGAFDDTRDAATKPGTSLFVGTKTSAVGTVFGDVDDVAVYEKALPADRVLAHFHAAGR